MTRHHTKPALVLALLGLVLVACGGQSPEAFPTPRVAPDAATMPASTAGPVPGTVVRFPEDEAPHPVITEWWYYTGHVSTADGARYGVEFVIFQGSRGDFPIGYAAHFAVSDPATGTFAYDQDTAIARDVAFGGRGGFDLHVNAWTMRGVNGSDALQARMKNGAYGIDIAARDAKGPVLQGGGQFSYGPGGNSYYYSRTRMQPAGTITVGAETKQITGGTLWFDHQWGNFLPSNGGWDWFSTQLDDNSEMMIYHLRGPTGEILQIFGEYVPPCPTGCDPTHPVPSIQLTPDQFSVISLGTWSSPATGITYPSTWRVRVAASTTVPAMDLTYTPVLPNAELDTRRSTGVAYWEGDTTITGSKGGAAITGSGYVELTGYDKSRP